MKPDTVLTVESLVAALSELSNKYSELRNNADDETTAAVEWAKQELCDDLIGLLKRGR